MIQQKNEWKFCKFAPTHFLKKFCFVLISQHPVKEILMNSVEKPLDILSKIRKKGQEMN